VSTRSTVLLVMVQASRSAPWKAAIEMAHVLGRPLAATLASVALDSRGYAAALPADDPLLQVSPSSLPVLYAGQMDSGPGPAVFAAGPNTTGFLAQDKAIEALSAAARLPSAGTKASGQLYEPSQDDAAAAGVTTARAGLAGQPCSRSASAPPRCRLLTAGW